MSGRICLALLWSAFGAMAGAAEPLPWVVRDPDGHLHYRTSPRGDRIMDFSFAGYAGGGVPPPDVPAVETLAPSGSDDTVAIQAALARVAAHAPTNGFHGALQLGPGTFHCFAVIRLTDSGVVIRGSGPASGTGTEIELTGQPHRAFEFGKGIRDLRAAARELVGAGVKISQSYVPAGTSTVEVASAGGFAPGDHVALVRPFSHDWIKFMGMADLTRNQRAEHWVSGAALVERQIKAVHGRELEFDVPLADSIDSRFQHRHQASVVKSASGDRSFHLGLEHLRIVAPPQHLTLNQAAFTAVVFREVEDSWMRDVVIQDTMDSVQMTPGSRRLTIERVDIQHQTAISGAALPADFSLDGTQILLDRCHDQGDRLFYVVTGPQVNGPNVVLRCVFEGNGSIMPHQRWATGLLVDQCKVPGGSIEFKNRGEMGSGHGWTIGWAVAWNCEAPTFVVQDPPGAMNWAIGCIGLQKREPMPFDKLKNRPLLPEGEIESPGRAVEPASLYLAQLQDRLNRK